jgi:hypothetical protein
LILSKLYSGNIIWTMINNFIDFYHCPSYDWANQSEPFLTRGGAVR